MFPIIFEKRASCPKTTLEEILPGPLPIVIELIVASVDIDTTVPLSDILELVKLNGVKYLGTELVEPKPSKALKPWSPCSPLIP